MLAMAFAVLLLAPVQRALLRRSLIASGATGVQLGDFHATPFGFAAEHVQFKRGPLWVDVIGLKAAVRPSGLAHRHLELARVSAEEVDVSWDLDAASVPRPAFSGLLQMLRLPFQLSIDAADLAGPVTLLHGSTQVAQGRWRLHFAHWAPGKVGLLEYAIVATSPTLIPGGVAQLAGTLAETQGPSGEPLRANLTGGLEMKDGSLASWPTSFGFEVTAGAIGESYAASAKFGADMKADLTGSYSPKQQVLQAHADFSGETPLNDRFLLLKRLLATGRPLGGSLDMAFSTKGPAWSVTRGIVELHGGPSGAAVGLDLTKPLPLVGRPEAGSLATLRIAHFPVAWTNPWLAATGLQLDPGEIAGAWNLELTGDTVNFVPTEPLTLAPFRIRGPRFPVIGGFRLGLNPRIELSRTNVHILVENFLLEDNRGRRIEAAADIVLAWNGAVSIGLNTFEGSVRLGPAGPPALDIKLLHPLDLSGVAAGLERAPQGDLLLIKVQNMPLGWISRWLPGRTIEGRLTAGESLVSNLPGKGLVVTTATPWRATGLRLVEGGREYFHGSLQASPASMYGPGGHWVRLENLSAEDVRGYRFKGRIGAALRSGDERMGGVISLEADLPRFPGAGPDSGPLRLNLSALAHAFPGGKGDLARFTLTAVTEKGRPLFSVSADQPISVERTAGAEWIVNSPRPLRFTTGELPLSRLNPFLAAKGIAMDGVIPPAELWLQLSPRRIQLESKTPLTVKQFRLERGGNILINRALLRVGFGLDVGVEYQLLPVFQMKSTAVFHLTDGLIAAEGSRVARFDGQIGMSANQQGGALHDVAGSLWLDLGALGRMPFLAQSRLPAKGS